MNVRRGLTVLAVAAAAAAATAVPASAAESSAELSIAPSWEYPGYYDVYVHGHVHTSAPNCAVGMRLKGDDPVFNDDLSVSASGSAYYGEFSLHRRVWHSYLNEDPEGRDEVFAVINACTGWSTDTNNVNGYF